MPNAEGKVKRILQQVDLKLSELNDLKPLKPADEERLWNKFRLEWNYNSNHLEGNTLTYSETQLLLMFDQAPTEPHTFRELEEMKAHDVAVAQIRQWATAENRDLSEADIRSLNETILVRPFWKDAETPDGQKTRRLISVGKYKEHPNHVRLSNGEVFRYTEPGDVAQEMGELMEWYRTDAKKLHPVVAAALLHYRFVRIHPFDDGNGRVSRLLLNYHLLHCALPPIVIKSDDKRNYLFALQRADVGDLDAFYLYVAEQALWSLDLSLKAAKEESVEEAGDWEKEVHLLKRELDTLQNANLTKSGEEQEGTVNWLERNIPILIDEMEKRIGVLASFFETAHFKIIISKKSGDTLNMLDNDLEWSKVVEDMKSIYSTRIRLAYEFRTFLYGPTGIAIEKNPHIDLYLHNDKIRIEGLDAKTEVSIWKDVVESDLEPIRILSKSCCQQIEKAKKKV